MVCDNKEGGGWSRQLRYNVLLPANTLQSAGQSRAGRDVKFISQNKHNYLRSVSAHCTAQ